MTISMFDLFSIGVGPSSSHTVGPMRGAHHFVYTRIQPQRFEQVHRVKIELFGSLALTGEGHGTPPAVLMGLMGELPESVDPDTIQSRFETVCDTHTLPLANTHTLSFTPATDLLLHKDTMLPRHSNAMRLTAFDAQGETLTAETYYSIGGGFIVTEAEFDHGCETTTPDVPYPFETAKTLLAHCNTHHLTIAELMRANESVLYDSQMISTQLQNIARIMNNCIEKGCNTQGILPGGLNVKRRAYDLHEKLKQKGKPHTFEHSDCMSWLNLFAIAVNEENAAGGRIVTAPTNGAAGILPAVMHYYETFYPDATPDAIETYLLTAGAIAILYKKGASISGAEVGCQGEVGVASSMAAAGLAAVLGGSLNQIENAAEIAMEHHLGMTCDPIAGLVQIPCIERNAMGAVKAVNAANLALLGCGEHYVSLDKVIRTMRETGRDMMSIYKETSQGGLAVNHPEC